MLFDSDNLAPLFRLEMGHPGSSFALEIAAKTGLPGETLRAANRIIGEGLIGLETLIKQVMEEKTRLDSRAGELAIREEQAKAALEKYGALSEKLEVQRKEILNRAKAEASSLLQETNREIEKTIKHIRENKANKQETRKVRDGLRELTEKVKPRPEAMPKARGALKEGDKVRLMGGEVTGTILSVTRTSAVVQFGSARTRVKIERLVRSDEADVAPQAGAGRASFASPSQFSPQLDVRGMRVDELVPALVRFVDNAVQSGMAEVSILHGKGEGVLRSVTRDYLKKRKEVSSFRDEHADRGGAGITVVSIR
jgi:DNA mismatch repair protein MutS2